MSTSPDPDPNTARSSPQPPMSQVITPPSRLLENAVVLLGAAVVLLVGAALWWGQMDAIVRAEAQIVPERDLVPVQTQNAGLLTEVPVGLGDRVAAGDLIARLVTQTSDADIAALERRVALLGDEADQLGAVVAAMAGLEGQGASVEHLPAALRDFAPAVTLFNDLRRAELEAARLARLVGPDFERWQDATRARIAALHDTLDGHAASKAAAQAERAALIETAALRQDRLALAVTLQERGLATEARVLEARDQMLGIESEIIRQDEKIAGLRVAMAQDRLQVAELEAQIIDEAAARNDRLTLAAQEVQATGMALQNLLVETRTRLRTLNADLSRETDLLQIERARARAMEVRAPTAGEIVALSHTAPGVSLQAGAEIAQLVPLGVPNILDARLPSRDAGRVRVGQRAIVKLDPFPFYRFGTQEAHVTAVFPEPGTGQFAVRLALVAQDIDIGGVATPIPVGAGAVVEIVTDRRRLVDILFDRGTAQLAGRAQ